MWSVSDRGDDGLGQSVVKESDGGSVVRLTECMELLRFVLQ